VLRDEVELDPKRLFGSGGGSRPESRQIRVRPESRQV
jgi:hypothetical protein